MKQRSHSTLLLISGNAALLTLIFSSLLRPFEMENLHAPTVPSGETTASVTNGDAGHLSFAELQRKKDDVEAELKALGGVLDSHGVDMNTSLLTSDGFPRADIDVAQSITLDRHFCSPTNTFSPNYKSSHYSSTKRL